MSPKPSENGTYRSIESSSNPSDNRGQQRFDVRCTAGALQRYGASLSGALGWAEVRRSECLTGRDTPSDISGGSERSSVTMGYSGMGSGWVRPSGTVTFLFTDIEGSTKRWEADSDAMRLELAAHDDLLRAAVESQGGWLFKHTGDGVLAAFASARAAVDVAIDAQRRLGLPVRMGIATGEAEQRGDDYFGPTLNIAARVMAAGHGGQILLDESTAALVDFDLADLGEFQLRGLSGRRSLFQVHAQGLRVDFPPLITVDSVPGNLPHETTSLVGRDADIAEVCDLMMTHRLVTLTGVGGVGKTRLGSAGRS